MDFIDLGPAMSEAATRDSIEKLRKDLAFIARIIQLDGNTFYAKELIQEWQRIASGKSPA